MAARPRRGRLVFCAVLGVVFSPWAAVSAGAAEEFRGFWADAFHSGFKSRSQIDSMVGRAVQGGYNAIIAEVLAYQDTTGGGHGAYWNSAILPKATDISGGIDPLAYLCQRAHAQGIEVHAWLVAYRVSTRWPPAGNATLSGHPEWLMVHRADMGGGPDTIGGKYTLDPGSPEVQDHLVGIVRELVTGYAIDGINWDYIRYTDRDAGYPADAGYDQSSLARFRRITGFGGTPSVSDSSWSDFRRRTIDELMRRCRAEIPAIKTNPRQPLRHTADLIGFGDAPGSCGGFSGTSAYILHQNWRHWLEEGWLDAGILMNYKREHCGSQASWYRNWVNRSNACWKYGRQMFDGQANYLNSFANSATQMQYARSAGADGLVNYSYASTLNTSTSCSTTSTVANWGWYDYVADQVFAAPASTPTMTWRDPATAVEGTTWGRVLEAGSGGPVDDATVSVGSPFGFLRSVQTDGNGYYVVTLLPAMGAGAFYEGSVSRVGLPEGGTPSALVLAGDLTRYDFVLGAPPARLTVTPSSIVRAVEVGASVADDYLVVRNRGGAGAAPLNYAVSVDSDVDWLEVSPRQGTSSGGSEVIEIAYGTAGLTLGNYAATIEVADGGAIDSPQVVSVTLLVGGGLARADFDFDGDVDLEDYAHLQNCYRGSTVPQLDPACRDARLDGDLDVDGSDLGVFIGCLSGAGVAADVLCAN